MAGSACDGRITKFSEKGRSGGRGLASAGIYVVNASVIRGLPPVQKLSWEHEVLPAYAGMFANRGAYLAAYNRHEQAVEAFRQALALDPGYEYARRAMAESENKLRGKSN